MNQMHKRFTTEQVRALLKGYHQETLDRAAIEEILGISKSRFFVLLREYRQAQSGPFLLTTYTTGTSRIPCQYPSTLDSS